MNRCLSFNALIRVAVACLMVVFVNADEITDQIKWVEVATKNVSVEGDGSIRVGGEQSMKSKFSLEPTFECCSVYVLLDESLGINTCDIEFKKKDEAKWGKGYPLVFDEYRKMFRGSLWGLLENKDYEVRVLLFDSEKKCQGVVEGNFKTWNPNPPVAKVIKFKDLVQDPELKVIEFKDQKNSDDAWVKIQGDGEPYICRNENEDPVIWIKNSSHLIFENITLVGGRRYGFHVQNSSNIRIINCDVSGYGRIGKQDFAKDGKYYTSEGYIDKDPGVFIDQSSNTVVERCFIHDPRGTANTWKYSHPAGPEAIHMRSNGGAVVRYNDFIGSDQHRWNDVIEGYDNGSKVGGFYKDGDAYGNMLAFGNDDGVEIDGGQMNVRIFKNRIEGTLTGVGGAPCLLGPSYIFRNLILDLGDLENVSGAGVKSGGGTTFSLGWLHLFQNTIISSASGIGGGGYGKDENRSMFRCVSRNNLIVSNMNGVYEYDPYKKNSFDYDLISPKSNSLPVYAGEGQESHAIIAIPLFKNDAGGDFRLQDTSPGKSGSTYVPGFSFSAEGVKSDVGAFDNGDLKFLPYRPIPLVPSCTKVTLSADLSKGTSSLEKVKIRVEGDKSWEKKFKIAKNQVFEWLKVTPESGVLHGGDEVEFTVELNKEKLAGGLNKGAFLIRLEDGFSVPISCYAYAYKKSFEKVILADEISVGKPTGELVDAPGLEGQKAILFSAQNKSEFAHKNVQFEIDIPEEGDYYTFVELKSILPRLPSETFYVSVDGGEFVKVEKKTIGEWQWIPVSLFGGKANGVYDRAWKAKPGNHKIKLASNEDFYLNRILFTTDSVPPLR